MSRELWYYRARLCYWIAKLILLLSKMTLAIVHWANKQASEWRDKGDNCYTKETTE